MKSETIGDRLLSAWLSRPGVTGFKPARHSSPANFRSGVIPGLWRGASPAGISAPLNFRTGWHGRGA